ncbi:hypothetical protein AGMMS49949_02440 [Alphaproteobacteria bacterium]|nr:hypothetical protein AGMMS49949_02440 [Alphaproteobacteria bacterium]GHS98221.1 hypothetical protein AGMMS50296_5780 [Alphaproteobacteria bacterium]
MGRNKRVFTYTDQRMSDGPWDGNGTGTLTLLNGKSYSDKWVKGDIKYGIIKGPGGYEYTGDIVDGVEEGYGVVVQVRGTYV